MFACSLWTDYGRCQISPQMLVNDSRTRPGASVGSVSLWLRGVRVPPTVESRRRAHLKRLHGRGAQAMHDAAIERQRQRVGAARASIPSLSARDLFMLGVALYWAEGTKDKPWARKGRVIFTNSDPDVAGVFLAWLTLVGVPAEDVRYRLSIHESARLGAGAMVVRRVASRRCAIRARHGEASQSEAVAAQPQRDLPRLPGRIRCQVDRVIRRDRRLVVRARGVCGRFQNASRLD